MTDNQHAPSDDQPDGPLDEVGAHMATLGAYAQPLRRLIVRLTTGPATLETLVRESALPRRTVEELITALGEDLDHRRDGLRIRPDRVTAYRERIGYRQLVDSELADPLAPRMASAQETVGRIRHLIEAAPAARQALDHVVATAETVVRRALWLDSTFDLAGARLLCVGDHDLTSLAACMVNPGLTVTVVDVDEQLLEFVDGHAARLGLDVRCLFADLRFALPRGAVGSADVVLTDPPYTPEGAALFVARGLEGLRDPEHGRLVMAYGFSGRHPALGLKVQQAVQRLHVVYEAILPGFSRYHGAQAVGSASDLYVCRPTAQTWKALERPAEGPANIYTHGPQALEATPALEPATAEALLAAATGPEPSPPPVVVAESSAIAAIAGDGPRVGLSRVMSGGLPAGLARRDPVRIAADLAGDPGTWLPRALLAINAGQAALLVPNGHPDLADEAAQQGLRELVAAKYELVLRRSFPTPKYAVVEARRIDADRLDSAGALARWVLEHAHGKVANVWREALVALSRQSGTQPLTKNEARSLVRSSARRPELLEAVVMELPRHQLASLLEELAVSAARMTEGEQVQSGSR